MLNIDLLISVGIWVCGVATSAIGIEMTINPPNRENNRAWRYRSAFVVLGVGFIGLSIWQFARQQGKELLASQQHQAELIRSEGNIKYVQGQLDTTNRILASVAANSDPGQTQILLKALLANRNNLKKETLAVCSEMEQWGKERMKTDPAPTAADPQKPTAQESDAQSKYWLKLSMDYYTRFGPRVLAIIQQYAGKGVEVKNIEQQLEAGYMNPNIVPFLRACAERLDDSGNLKH